MGSIYRTIWFGIKETLTDKNYLALFLLAFLLMLVLFTFIPIWAVPGNSIAIQLDIFKSLDYLTILFLSGLYALFVAMQTYLMRQKKSLGGIATSIGGGASTLFAGIAGTAFCASCLAPLFALFGIGFGGVIFVLEYRFYFVIGILALMLAAIYFTAQKIEKRCKSCKGRSTERPLGF